MNKKLTIITLLIFFAIGMQTAFKVLSPLMDSIASENVQQEQELSDDSIKSYMNLEVDCLPRKSMSDTVMVYNEKTNEWVPAKVEKISVEIKEKQVSLFYIIPLAFIFLALICAVLFQLYKLTTAVAKSKIFEWANVKRLKYIGYGFILLFLLDAAGSIALFSIVNGSVHLPNYRLDMEWDAIYLILGLFSLLIAEIFARGLRLQEEQDLTI